MFGRVHFKDVSKKPPKAVPRPGDEERRVVDVEVTMNVETKTTYTGGSMSFAEMDATVARQTGLVD